MKNSAADTDVQGTATKTSIVLVTSHYPYGLYESFLEHELPALTKRFEKVVIVCRDVSSSGERPLHGATVHRVNPVSSWVENIITMGLCAANAFKIWRFVRDELDWLSAHRRKPNTFILDDLIHTVVKALQTARHLRRIIRAEELSGHVLLYSYWLSSSALALPFVSSKRLRFSAVSRAHGGDVYEYRNTNQYLPFRRTLIHQLDRIFAISDDAAAHLRRQGNEADHHKIQVARLGTAAAGNAPAKTGKRLTVVSCAFLVAVKRVHLMIDALQQIDGLDIHWVHIGDGPQNDEISRRAKERLSSKSNVTYQLMGARTNEQLMQFYRDTYVDVFVNTSSAEGVPVTIMEAQSFGIPVVAPRVGGVPEIVSDQTGRLFEVDASPLHIAYLIAEILRLPAADAKAMRHQAFQNWKTHYNADRNFSTFVADLEKL